MSSVEPNGSVQLRGSSHEAQRRKHGVRRRERRRRGRDRSALSAFQGGSSGDGPAQAPRCRRARRGGGSGGRCRRGRGAGEEEAVPAQAAAPGDRRGAAGRRRLVRLRLLDGRAVHGIDGRRLHRGGHRGDRAEDPGLCRPDRLQGEPAGQGRRRSRAARRRRLPDRARSGRGGHRQPAGNAQADRRAGKGRGGLRGAGGGRPAGGGSDREERRGDGGSGAQPAQDAIHLPVAGRRCGRGARLGQCVPFGRGGPGGGGQGQCRGAEG